MVTVKIDEESRREILNMVGELSNQEIEENEALVGFGPTIESVKKVQTQTLHMVEEVLEANNVPRHVRRVIGAALVAFGLCMTSPRHLAKIIDIGGDIAEKEMK